MTSGRIVFSSKLPCDPANATAESFPMTWIEIMIMASHCVGFTLPGMIEDPGSLAGNINSPSPQRGPDASQRISLAIFVSGDGKRAKRSMRVHHGVEGTLCSEL